MSNKTPIAVALERQIPEYIRGEYELFVNFIKAYYEFLDQSQQRNLEDIRSIDNTLEEFVLRFKKELSVLFPTNTLANERFILQRIREFYQSRGSKESYQFLFRILFNKDSDIFYPSTQILKASDGKWVQEKSVFVQSVSGNLFNLTGKIIDISTTNKQIHVFSPRVVLYRPGVYEVFIDRSYTADISIGDTVESQDGEDTGIILPCPNKYTITTEGAGFEVGALYYLKTESGDGSLIKITKIGNSIEGSTITNGLIKKIQVINFGLDYKSTFYAQLSNKTRQAFSYYTPITSFTVGSDHPSGLFPTSSYTTTNPYSDQTTGFVDLGYINKQDYFYYDSNYEPAGNNNEKVFYADGTYVGEIIGSFYTNASTTNVIDTSTAEIKIELGAVAVYPGYYSASDGFISDESFIQDGKYYQLFSYVIRVEQQIESYYDIVKQLMHPAGTELFAEYTIKNSFSLLTRIKEIESRMQFLEAIFMTDDESANTIEMPKADALPAIHSFLQDIKDKQISIRKYDSSGSLIGIQLNSVLVSGTAGQFTTTSVLTPSGFPIATPLVVGQLMRVIGTLSGSGTISQYETKNAGSFVIGRSYKIVSVGTTDFISIGATSNAIDQVFIAIGVGSGTGTAKHQEPTAANSTIYRVSSVSFSGATPYQFVLTNIDGTALTTTAGSTTGLTFSTMETNAKWSTVDPYTLKQYDMLKGSANDPIENSLVSTAFTRINNIAKPREDDVPQLDQYAEDFARGTTEDSITSIQSAHIWELSGGSWNKSVTVVDEIAPVRFPQYEEFIDLRGYSSGGIQYDADFFTYIITYARLLADATIPVESGRDWVWSGETFNQSTSSVDGTPFFNSNRPYTDAINNTNTGILYYNTYNQDTSDPSTSFSYEAETYSEHTTKSL